MRRDLLSKAAKTGSPSCTYGNKFVYTLLKYIRKFYEKGFPELRIAILSSASGNVIAGLLPPSSYPGLFPS